MIDLIEIEPELREPIPRLMRWEFEAGVSANYREKVTQLLQYGVATRARILQCEWFDDGRTDEISPSIRARYEYYDQDNRQYIKTFEGSYDDWHLALNPSNYYSTLARTWYVGGHVTVLYPATNPLDSRIYSEMSIKLVSPPPAKQLCPCCSHRTLEPEEFVRCPHCGHYTLKKPVSEKLCRVCGWVTGGNNPISIEQARQNYKLFGRCDELEIYWEQPQPYPEEIIASRFVPPRIWLADLSPDTYREGICEALQPFYDKFNQDWQILIAQHPVDNKFHPTSWWEMYNPTEVGFIQWRSTFEETLAPLELTDTTIRNLCIAMVEGLRSRHFILDTTNLKAYEPTADWLYWFLITDEWQVIECRFGKVKQR